MLFEGTLMGTALRRMLTIDEGMVFLTVLVGMSEGNLNILTLEMDNRIESVIGHTVIQQVLESMTGENAPVIIHNGKTCIQIGIVTEHILHDIILKLIVEEECVVGFEEDEGSIFILGILRDVTGHLTFLKGSLTDLSVAIAAYFEMGTQGIDGLHTHTVETHRLLESLGVVLTTSVQYGYSLNHLSLRDASAIVADRDAQIVLDGHLETVASLHLEFVDRVIDHLLQQHIDTILRQ